MGRLWVFAMYFVSVGRLFGFAHYGGAVQVDPEFAHWTPRLLSALETEIDKPVSNVA